MVSTCGSTPSSSRGRAHIHTWACSLTEEFDKTAMAVGLVVLLFEGALVELLQAEGAHKVLWVELLAHGCDAAAGDGLLAATAKRASALVIVRLAVRLTLVVKEASIYERREALLEKVEVRTMGFEIKLSDLTVPIQRVTHPAYEAFRVPESVKSRDVILQDSPGTPTTFWSKHVKVVLSTVSLSILLMEP